MKFKVCYQEQFLLKIDTNIEEEFRKNWRFQETL